MDENGQSGVILRPSETGDKAAYFSIDLLVIEAIKVREASGYPAHHLRRYLASRNKKLASPFEENQFAMDRYKAWEDCGLLMSGILMNRFAQEKVHPARGLADYFAELHEVMGEPEGPDKDWLDTKLKPELEALAQQLFGKKAQLHRSDVTDRLGLWWCDTTRFSASIKYWPFTIYPRYKSAPDREKHRKAARERGIGNLLVALYRAQHGRDADTEKAHADMFSKPEFQVLWDTLLIPRCIYIAVPPVQRTINSDSALERYKDVPDLIQRVFDEKFDLGSRRVEKELFNSYPLHLQYLDSILYRWSKYDPKTDKDEIPADPRLDPSSLVEKSIE
jgi:hypothetical protein